MGKFSEIAVELLRIRPHEVHERKVVARPHQLVAARNIAGVGPSNAPRSKSFTRDDDRGVHLPPIPINVAQRQSTADRLDS